MHAQKSKAYDNGHKHCHQLTVPHLTVLLNRWLPGITELTANAVCPSAVHQLH
jgi:hypothetical protein